ncbi:MT-A70-domain-containing protein [Macrolepiota fuliginosa MF-IS2]|uniref:mRNA m(6)A methyltransferase n=1 Tax=Macrolepiota fuliginosa MF-IS2 TaxID=1400762 RepID=A0A9P5XN86_9AGAR|nr:MT-A70-domain-containing protein [Macrolepiota fuliginosa MF-IS2]
MFRAFGGLRELGRLDEAYICKKQSVYTPEQISQWLECLKWPQSFTSLDLAEEKFPNTLQNLAALGELVLMITSSSSSENHVMDIDPQSLFRRFVVHRRGSYCFGLNILFLWMLRGLGYRAYASLGRVNENGDPGATPEFTGLTHMVIFVQLGGESRITYLVDVGCGGSGPTMPILLSDAKDNIVMGTTPTEKHRLRRGSHPESSVGTHEWILEVLHEKPDQEDLTWRVVYMFSEREAFRNDFEIASRGSYTAPTGFFADQVICSIHHWLEEDDEQNVDLSKRRLVRVGLMGRLLKRFVGSNSEFIKLLHTEEERAGVLREYFACGSSNGRQRIPNSNVARIVFYTHLLITALKIILNNGHKALIPPITSAELLTRIMTAKLPSGLFAPSSKPTPRFRLTDLHRLENVIEGLSQPQAWDEGHISVSRDKDTGEMTIWEIGLGPRKVNAGTKRKRVIDEEADSAAGSDGEEEDEVNAAGGSGWAKSTLGGLSKEMREVYALLQKGTAKGKLLAEQFRSPKDAFEPICAYITKEDCAKARLTACPGFAAPTTCDRVHFRPLIRPHTDPTLGHCSYLNTCYSEPTYAQSPSIPAYPGSTSSRGPVSLPSGLGAGGRGKEKAPCRYLHYEVDWDPTDADNEKEREREREQQRALQVRKRPHRLDIGLGPHSHENALLAPQWINCDLRKFDYSVLGKFHVIMADPPWDIHMSLPYGTMTDDEMRAMPIPALQDEGLLFLWVTGRAMEVGRECLRVWGYTRIDEVIWVKTNQLQRVIRTGRTGHWLNHTKEHMLVGVKTPPLAPGDSEVELKLPKWVNRGVDTDVIVSEVRETSRKPDEVYGLIERMCPGGRKIEIFGRRHNTRPGWLTLGNQLGPMDQICEEDLLERVQAKYPERKIHVPPAIPDFGH